jgi:hypothetical protein
VDAPFGSRVLKLDHLPNTVGAFLIDALWIAVGRTQGRRLQHCLVALIDQNIFQQIIFSLGKS